MNSTQVVKALKALSGMAESISDRKVVKTVPMRKEWKARLDALNEARAELKKAEDKKDAKHRQFWAQVEEDLEVYTQMSVNEETNEIEIYEE